MFIKKFLKKNYKIIIVISLIILLLSNKVHENFSTTQALDAVKATEKKVNDIALNVGANHIDLKSKIKLSGKWMNSAGPKNSEISNDTTTFKTLMIVGNSSAAGVRKVGIWDHLDVNGNQNVTGNLAVNGDVKGKKFCIGGTCIDENHLKVLTGDKHIYIGNKDKNAFLTQEGSSWSGNFKGTERPEKERQMYILPW
jgi:hypothetical protein